MAVGQDIDVIRIEDAEIHPHPVRPWNTEEDILAVFVHYLALIRHGDGKAHSFQGEARIISVHVGKAGACGKHHLAVYPARKDSQPLPCLLPLFRGQGLHDMARLVILPVEVNLKVIAEHDRKFLVRDRRRHPETVGKGDEFLRFPDGERRLAVDCSFQCF